MGFVSSLCSVISASYKCFMFSFLHPLKVWPYLEWMWSHESSGLYLLISNAAGAFLILTFFYLIRAQCLWVCQMLRITLTVMIHNHIVSFSTLNHFTPNKLLNRIFWLKVCYLLTHFFRHCDKYPNILYKPVTITPTLKKIETSLVTF